MNKTGGVKKYPYWNSAIWLAALLLTVVLHFIHVPQPASSPLPTTLLSSTRRVLTEKAEIVREADGLLQAARLQGGSGWHQLEGVNAVAEQGGSTPDVSAAAEQGGSGWHQQSQVLEASSKLRNNNIRLFIYNDSQLVYWNDNQDNIPNLRSQFPVNDNFIFLGNTWYVAESRQLDSYLIVYLTVIKQEFAYENEFLHNQYPAEFPEELAGYNPVDYEIPGSSFYAADGSYLFSLVPQTSRPAAPQNDYDLMLAYLFTLLLAYSLAFRRTASLQQYYQTFALFAGFVIGLRFFTMYLHFPARLYASPLFTPYPFAWSDFFPSLGDFFLSTFSFFLISLFLFSRSSLKKTENSPPSWLLHLEALITGGFFVLANYLIQGLIEHSSFIVDLNRVNEIEMTSVGVYVIAGILFGTIILLSSYTIQRSLAKFKLKPVSPVFSSLLLLPVIFTLTGVIEYKMLFWLGLLITLYLLYHLKKREYNYSYKMLLLLMMVIGAVGLIYPLGKEKIEKIKQVYASNLSTERDYMAELSLMNLTSRMLSDTLLAASINSEEKEYEKVYRYIADQYLNSYLSTYYFQLYICSEKDSIVSEDEDINSSCFGFFDRLIEQAGVPVSGNNFYFIDDKDGTITYLGRLNFKNRFNAYMLLDEKWTINELGYPELLIENFSSTISDRYHFSYAKYHQGNLVKQSGSYAYSSKATGNMLQTENQLSWEENGYKHFVFQADDRNIIIVSSKSGSYYDIIILFSYLFFLFHLIFSLGTIILNFSSYNWNFRFNYKNRIQLSMIAIVIAVILIIGSLTISFNIRQFNRKHLEMLTDKMRSVQIELEHKLTQEKNLDASMKPWLSEMLIKFSNVFYTDINLYDEKGNLIVSSRQELFDKKLSGLKMNPEAFRQMQVSGSPLFIHTEELGTLSYLSAYTPFRNSKNEVLAYLNLPYFTRESLIRDEIAGLINAAVNIYLLLIIITVMLTILLANRLTRPLLLIQDKLGKINLIGQNEKIEYSRKDEIGDLIEKYNHMLEELTKSADLLAKSERESAWREMARQIAHEIKNPLTPMKLHVQHLQKMIDSNQPGFEERVRKVSEILITQIDSLNEIAGEFSNFASLSTVSNKPVSLRSQLLQVYALFSKEVDSSIVEIQLEEDKDYIIESNDEQINRMLINLIKNALQSIPEDRKGLVKITLSRLGKHYQLKIQDNGKGIHPEVADRLFEPYFTTKSSGTGLGLAIVKGIVESSNGTIRYETVLNEGSCFFIQFPAKI